MCGIIGIINGIGHRTADRNVCDYVRDAIVADSLRGMDSTGIFQKGKDRKLYWYKEAISGSEFIQKNITQGYLRDADDSPFTVVHNRAATQGTVTQDNAHPFNHIDDTGRRWIIGVHNGTLNGWDKYETAKEFQVDSDWAINRIAVEGTNAFDKFEGAYTFVWYDDTRPGFLFMARNALRPMFYNYIKGTNRMVFGSEFMMLSWLAHRNSMQLEGAWRPLEPDYVYEFSLDNPHNFTRYRQVSPYTQGIKRAFISKVSAAIDRPPTLLQSLLHREVVEGSSHKRSRRAKASALAAGVSTATSASPEEVTNARLWELHDSYVTLRMEVYLDDDKELWGTVVEDGVTYTAVVRGVEKQLGNNWMTYEELGFRVIGCAGKVDDPILILAPSASTSAASAPVVGQSTFDEALKKAMNSFSGVDNDRIVRGLN